MRSLSTALAVLAIAVAGPATAQGQGPATSHDHPHAKATANEHAKGPASGRAQARAEQRGQGRAQAHPKQRGHEAARPSEQAQARGRASERTPAAARERGRAAAEHGAAARARQEQRLRSLSPGLRRFAEARRKGPRLVAGAISRGGAHGLDGRGMTLREEGDQLLVLAPNRTEPLLRLRRDGLDQLGSWDVRPVRESASDQAPAFCRSGAGHPVFGREWCLRKGFGLGDRSGLVWGRTRLDDVVYRGPRIVNGGRLTTDALAALLGRVAFDRLALQALALGSAQPLRGTWLVPQTGPTVLQLTAGDVPVAELADLNRDARPDVLLVNLPL